MNKTHSFYTMAMTGEEGAEITMYGTIVDCKPKNFWTGEEVDGEFIVLKDFLTDLNTISSCKKLTVRMNSLGGDAGVAITIHNRLRELADSGVETECIVDGMAMSGGSLIMCACDKVKVNPSSLIMIHKCWAELWGGYNADDLRKEAEAYDAYDKAQASIYKRKCGLSETVILHMMANTTYMTGEEAVEKGFADELIENAEPLGLAASADGRSIYVRGKEVHLTYGMFAPDFIPTLNTEKKSVENKQAAVTVGEEGGSPMTKDELRENYPDLVQQIVAEAMATVNTDTEERILAERTRIREIDEIGSLYAEEIVTEAKYGETACSAQELAYRAAQSQAKAGKKVLDDLISDTSNSGAVNVASVPSPEEKEKSDTPEEKMETARAFVSSLFGKNNKEE